MQWRFTRTPDTAPIIDVFDPYHGAWKMYVCVPLEGRLGRCRCMVPVPVGCWDAADRPKCVTAWGVQCDSGSGGDGTGGCVRA